MKTMRRMMFTMVLAAAACGGGSGDDDDDTPPLPDGLTAVATIPAESDRALDLLLVIDNSGSMGEEQSDLGGAIEFFLQDIVRANRVLPDLHVGVVSTNVGTGGVMIGGCSTAAAPDGDNGQLQTSGCTAIQGTFLSDGRNPDGSRVRNYSGDLNAAVRCMTQLGITGCGFEQPLEAMKRALSPGRNPGFLRPDAALGVLFLTDEDDCSTLPGGAMFGDPNATIDSPLGPRTSFRCFEFGVQCDDDPDPRAFGLKSGCVPRADSPHMPTVQPYIDFLRGLKASPSAVVVAAIAGDVGPSRFAEVGPDVDDATRPMLQPSCTSGSDAAAPALRLRSFLDGFIDRNLGASICASAGLSRAMEDFADRLVSAVGSPCISQTLADLDAATPGLQPRCEVTQYTLTTGMRSDPVTIPACTTGGPLPCWRLDDSNVDCTLSLRDYALAIDRELAAPAGTEIEARCQLAP